MEIKKVADGLDDHEKFQLTDRLASSLGLGRFDIPRTVIRGSEFGLCSTCKSFNLVRSQFKVLFAKCFENNFHLHSETPVTECSSYDEVGRPSLSEMVNMAWEINPGKKTVGFEVSNEE